MGIVYALGPVAMGLLLDVFLGDPHWLYHPVRFIGSLIAWLEPPLRRIFLKTPGGELAAGRILAVLVPGLTLMAVFAISALAAFVNVGLWLFVETILCYFLFATRSLQDESMAVYKALAQEDLPAARTALSRIVGRETQTLEPGDIVRASVETVAENTCDGVIAPMLYTVIWGAAAGWCYKAVNTLDSMVGYKNQQYLYFGRASAKLDDLFNWLPARIAALGMVLSAGLLGCSVQNSWRIWRRDKRCHASPNSAQTESAVAGALGIQLGGDAVYFGKVYHKPTIGDNLRMADKQDIPMVNKLMFITSILCFCLFTLCKAAVMMVLWKYI